MPSVASFLSFYPQQQDRQTKFKFPISSQWNFEILKLLLKANGWVGIVIYIFIQFKHFSFFELSHCEKLINKQREFFICLYSYQ